MNLSDCSTAVRTRLGSLYIHLYLQNYKGRNYYHPTLLTDFTRREAVADLGWVPPARAPPTAQNFLNFMQFFAQFGKIICWRPLEGWRSLLRGILDPPLRSMILSKEIHRTAAESWKQN